MASRTACPVTIAAALRRVEEEFGLDSPRWIASNDQQRLFLERYYGLLRDDALKIPEIESVAANRPEPINEFLRAKGFTIALGPFENASSIGVASVLDILAKWLQKGERTQVTRKGTEKKYPAVEIKAVDGARFFTVPGHQQPIVQLVTQTKGDTVFMSVGPEAVSFDLVEKIRAIASAPQGRADLYDRVIFPMISLRQQEDISWIKELTTPHTSGLPLVIVQALQENRMRMDEVGVRIQSAVAMEGTLRGMPTTRPLVIDEPFYFWYVREGCQLPVFCAWLDVDTWQDPGGLG